MKQHYERDPECVECSALVDLLEQRDEEIKRLRNEIAELNGQTVFLCPCGSGGISEAAMEEIERLRAIIGDIEDSKRPAHNRPCGGGSPQYFYPADRVDEALLGLGRRSQNISRNGGE